MSAAVYRMYDSDDQALYIGCSVSWPARVECHEDKPWWMSVERIAITHYGTAAEAADAEKRAIGVEEPLHNTHHIDLGLQRARRRERDAQRERERRDRDLLEESDRAARGVYAVSIECWNCCLRITEAPIGVPVVDAPCTACGLTRAAGPPENELHVRRMERTHLRVPEGIECSDCGWVGQWVPKGRTVANSRCGRCNKNQTLRVKLPA